MNTYTQEELNQILAMHKLFIDSNSSAGKLARLSGAHLARRNLAGVCLREAYLRGACFSGADLRGADLSNADLGRAEFKGANLLGASLEGSYLAMADFRGATMPGPEVRVGEVCLFLGSPVIFMREEGQTLFLLGANGILREVPVWRKWSCLLPYSSLSQR